MSGVGVPTAAQSQTNKNGQLIYSLKNQVIMRTRQLHIINHKVGIIKMQNRG